VALPFAFLILIGKRIAAPEFVIILRYRRRNLLRERHESTDFVWKPSGETLCAGWARRI